MADVGAAWRGKAATEQEIFGVQRSACTDTQSKINACRAKAHQGTYSLAGAPMVVRRTLLTASMVCASLTLAAATAAADGPAKAPRPDPYAYEPQYVVTDYNWSGIYVGGHVGGATASWDWTFTSPTEAFSQSQTGFAGGAQVGVQKQWGRAVLGVEVSYTWADLGTSSGSTAAPGESRTSELNNLLMVTGRVGATYENMLAYAKGGYASADIDLRSSITATGVTTTASSGREHGWVAGVGFEYGLTPSINIGVEYNFIHFNIDTRDQIPTPSGVAGSQTDGGVDVQTLMARLNFKFGPRAAPLVVK
jgi:outer membrane immunogenic protein